MSRVLRTLASELLQAVVRHAPGPSRSWGTAMLREMDFIANDRAALQWALGSTAAVFGHSIRHGRSAAELARAIGRGAGGLALSAMFCACVVAICVLLLTRVSPVVFPGAHLAQLRFAQCMSVVGIPELIFAVSMVALWRKRKILSFGILTCGVALAAHSLIYVAQHHT